MLKFAVGNWVEGIYGTRDPDFKGPLHATTHERLEPRYASIRLRRRCESAAPSLAAHRRSLAAVGNGPSAPPSQSVILRNTNPSSASSTLSLRVRPTSRNSTVHATEDLPSPTASSSAYSSNAAQLSLTLPGSSASSSSQYYPGYIPAKEHLKDPHARYHSPSPYDTISNTLIGSSSTTTISNGTEESPRIWQSPNHTTTMIINDPSSQACTSTVHNHHKLSLTPNGCRKSMVINGTLSSNGLAGSEVTNSKSSYLSSNASNNSTYGTNSHSDYNGTVTRRAMLSGNGSPYKNSTRILQNSNGKIGNGLNSSPRNSVSSFSSTYTNGTSLATNNGYENGSPHTRQSPIRQHSNSPTSITSEDSTVVVRMVPDLQGRFGFNVSGGYDRGYPVIVSRVVPLSPADKCHPRLNVGDMVLKINGQDISLWSYERVVSCIRNIRSSTALGEIQLTIKPNVYRCGEVDDADLPQATPEVTHVSETVPRSDKLATSLTMLKDSLDTGKIVRQFEQLYRKKPGFTMNDSRASMNISKNRYRDVVPYDSTRVRLERAPSGDYINANHVNMEIPSSGIVNRYIATQGPLAHTTSDFWFMVWEQGCTTIVMLTTLVEKGRIKCHQYWPSRKETLECGYLVITNVSERLEAHCQYRELAIRNKNTREERRVTQMQYTAWPDHGVPDNPKHFIDFVGEVRRARNGSLDPIIVHCSAGIGRTGVLILMETASCLIEANEPVYPLDIVRTMRDQRAMLIQTSDQYTFVCESILRAYKEDVIRPLAEYQKCR
uniref:PDZ domain-containing protein n=1 Tax=Panagrellus redivivus TaxID=6233 RepID=A0A7E4UW84_PANRE